MDTYLNIFKRDEDVSSDSSIESAIQVQNTILTHTVNNTHTTTMKQNNIKKRIQ